MTPSKINLCRFCKIRKKPKDDSMCDICWLLHCLARGYSPGSKIINRVPRYSDYSKTKKIR